jgi:FkbM family methyltransferase
LKIPNYVRITFLRRLLTTAALRSGLFDTVRSAYHVVGNRSYYRQLKARQALFAPFIHPGDLVFDVGANKGEFTLCFKRLGARVVSVEPNPHLASTLRARFNKSRVVEAAVSEKPGNTMLYLGTDSNYSTIVSDWLPTTQERGRLSTQAVDVRVTTLDALIDRFGLPVLVKIDVEANELPVLRGLTSAVKALLFEYQCPRLAEVPLMLDHLDSLGTYAYGWLEHGAIQWGTRAELLRTLESVRASGVQSGDVYCRLLR